jgi:hypothetical protein
MTPRLDPTLAMRGHDIFGFDSRMSYQRRRLLEAAERGHLPLRPGLLGDGREPRRIIDTSRVLEHRKLDRPPPRSDLVDEYSDPRLRPRPVGQRRDTMPFGTAMIQLHKQIENASAFYNEFHTDYDCDVQPIKRYATVDVLSKLWVLKVIGKHDPRTTEGDEVIEDDESLRFKVKFRDMKLRVEKALDAALSSTLKGGQHHSRRCVNRMESAKRLKEKVDTANEQILILLDAAADAREHCRALVDELELLKGLINPDLDNNKDLYKSGGSDAMEDTSDAENGYDEE